MKTLSTRILAADVDGKKWNLVFPRGHWVGANLQPIGGKIDLDEGIFEEMIANWRDAGSPALPITFHHVSPEPVPGVSDEERKKAAGWYEDFRVTKAGLEGLTSWTPNAIARIKADEYRFTSPEWTQKGTDRRTGKQIGWWLYGAALLNDPFFHAQPRVAASTQPQSGPAPHKEEQHMKKICAALGLDENSTEDAMVAAITELLKKSKASLEVDQKLTAASVEAKTLKASLEEAVSANAKLSARVTEIETERSNLAADTLANRLVSERRIVAAQKEDVIKYVKATNLKDAEAFFGKLVPNEATKPGEVGHSQGGAEDVVVDLKTLTAKYTAEVDKKIAAGMKTGDASRAVRAMPEFAPLNKGTKSTSSSWDANGN